MRHLGLVAIELGVHVLLLFFFVAGLLPVFLLGGVQTDHVRFIPRRI